MELNTLDSVEKFRRLIRSNLTPRPDLSELPQGNAKITFDDMKYNTIRSRENIDEILDVVPTYEEEIYKASGVQHEAELDILSRNPTCNRLAPLSRGSKYTAEEINQLLFGAGPVASPRDVEKAVCMIRSKTWDSYSTSTPKIQLERLIRNPRKIGEGANGAVYSATLGNRQRAIAIKREKESEKDDPIGALVHEAFVSIIGLTRMYELNPNVPPIFSRVLGLASCSNTVLEGRENWCPAGEGVVCFYEFIEGKDLAKMMELGKLTPKDVSRILTILIDGLSAANRIIGFTHYDLHTGNIIIQDLGRPQKITLSCGSQITTRYLPKIIDYGYSRVEFEGLPYGNWKVWNGPNPTVSNIIGDIVRYLITSFGFLKSDNQSFQSLYAVGQTFADFFVAESLRSFVRKELDFRRSPYKGSYYYLSTVYDNVTVPQFLQRVRRLSGNVETLSPFEQLLSCDLTR